MRRRLPGWSDGGRHSRQYATVIIASMSLSNLRPHVKLGFLLVAAAALVVTGSSGAFWAFVASDRLGLSGSQYGWLFTVGRLGGLFAVAAVIWVDARPPHGMMVAGALVLAVGLAFLTLSDSFALAVVAAFIAAAGGAAVGPLIFYVVAVKGVTRHKGVLIGALSLVFSVMWTPGAFIARETSLPVGWWAVIMVIAGGYLLLVFLPRWFTRPDGAGQTLRETVAVPGTKMLILWVAAVYLVGEMIMAAGTTHLRFIALAMSPGITELGFGLPTTLLVAGIGALLWGISADFFPVRRLLIAVAALSIPAAACWWLPGGQAAGLLLLSLILGGLISLPWVLLAESLPVNHFAKLALGITWVGLLGRALGPVYWGWALEVGDTNAFFWIIVAEMAALLGVVAGRPGVPRSGS